MILVHRILKSCTFLSTCPQVQWILGLSVSFGSSLQSSSVKIACSLAGIKKGICTLMVDSPFVVVFHKGKVAHVAFLKSFSKMISNFQLF